MRTFYNVLPYLYWDSACMAILLDLSIDAGYTVYLLILYYKIIVIFPSFFDPFVEIIIGIDMGDQCLYLALLFFYSSHALHYDCTSDGLAWYIQFPDSFTLAFSATWFIVFMYLNFVSHEMILINVFKRAV